MRPEIHAVDVKLDDTAGAASEGEPSRYPELCVDHTVQVAGTFTGDLRLEVSNDGASWVELDAFTAPGIGYYGGISFRMLRVRTEAITLPASPTVRYAGMNVRVEA